MLLRSIRSRMLGLVVATVVPFAGLIGAGLWNQWRTSQAAAIQRALDEARLLAAQVDDHIGDLDRDRCAIRRAHRRRALEPMAHLPSRRDPTRARRSPPAGRPGRRPYRQS